MGKLKNRMTQSSIFFFITLRTNTDTHMIESASLISSLEKL